MSEPSFVAGGAVDQWVEWAEKEIARLTAERDRYKDAFDLQTAKNFSLSADLAAARAATQAIVDWVEGFPDDPSSPFRCPPEEMHRAFNNGLRQRITEAKDTLSRLGTGETLAALRGAGEVVRELVRVVEIMTHGKHSVLKKWRALIGPGGGE